MNMTDWKAIYENRKTTVEQAISTIQSYHKVFLAPFCNEPQTLVEELVRQKDRLREVSLYNIVIGSPCIYAASECFSHFKIRTFLSSAQLKQAFINKTCDYVPVNLSEIPELIKEEKIDIALIQVSPPNDEGYCNLGVSVDVVQTLIQHAAIVIAEVNKNMPFTYGDTFVHVSRIHHFIESQHKLLTIPYGKPSEEELKIGTYVASLIPDYATIQVGVGKVANSVLLSLKNKKGLGIHSGSITDPVIELMEMGVVTNERKEVKRHKTVCTTLTGTNELYDYCDRNEKIELMPTNYTHNATIISNISNFYSVNSALEVSITGQINAEQVGNYPIAGVGGQMDFILGSRISPGGKAIIALPSTAKKGKESRIKFDVPYVTSIKSEIDYVVTEYGIAKLFGKSLQERAKELIAVAHPDFRAELTSQMNEQMMK